MTKICRYVDDPPSIFFMELDEIAVFGTVFLLGILSDTLMLLMLFGLGFALILKNIKKSRSEGFFMHFLYWHGIMPLKGCLPSYIRHLIE